MSGDWEKYVEEPARLLDPGAFDEHDPHHPHWAMEQRRDIARRRARLVLEQAGPRIAEDTRERMVAAATRVLEREGACSERTKVADEIAKAFEEARPIPGWGVFSRQPDRVTAARMVRQYARQLDAKEGP